MPSALGTLGDFDSEHFFENVFGRESISVSSYIYNEIMKYTEHYSGKMLYRSVGAKIP